MKAYKIKALRFLSQEGEIEEVNEDSCYMIQGFNKEFSIWKDYHGEYDPIYADLEVCHSLEEVHETLLNEGLILASEIFINLEDE